MVGQNVPFLSKCITAPFNNQQILETESTKTTTGNSYRQPFEPFEMNKLLFPVWSASRETDGSKQFK